ncbi:MAG: hypothetical protein FWE44_02730 [Defluviitaleaceae bacterium]|nr:hypothetical protein [Defluviitaleaceae bacterium]
MASAVSYEYLKAIQGVPGGIPTLDPNGNIPESQLPPTAISPYKGHYVDEAELVDENPTGILADYAFVDDTASFWYWNSALAIPAWVNQEITEDDYNVLSELEKSVVPYLIVPNPITP